MDQSGVDKDSIHGIGFDATCSLVVLDADEKPVSVYHGLCKIKTKMYFILNACMVIFLIKIVLQLRFQRKCSLIHVMAFLLLKYYSTCTCTVLISKLMSSCL